MEKEITVVIPQETSEKIERLFYSYYGGRETVAFLMKDSDVRWDVLQQYVNVVETRYAELEMLKSAISRQYLPDPLKYGNYEYDYEFLFDSSEIKYKVRC